jgi:hypothetical protein
MDGLGDVDTMIGSMKVASSSSFEFCFWLFVCCVLCMVPYMTCVVVRCSVGRWFDFAAENLARKC